MACWGSNSSGQGDAPAGAFTAIAAGGTFADAVVAIARLPLKDATKAGLLRPLLAEADDCGWLG